VKLVHPEWTYKGKTFDSDDIGDYVGFVYLIHDNKTGRKYVGKKLFHRKVTRPPLKGKKRKRIEYVESDWKTYYGSCKELQEEVKHEQDLSRFECEILHLCKTKGELSYLELKEQVDREVLLKDEYYNNIIQCRIHGKHLRKKV